jgi:hypothetical protein
MGAQHRTQEWNENENSRPVLWLARARPKFNVTMSGDELRSSLLVDVSLSELGSMFDLNSWVSFSQERPWNMAHLILMG